MIGIDGNIRTFRTFRIDAGESIIVEDGKVFELTSNFDGKGELYWSESRRGDGVAVLYQIINSNCFTKLRKNEIGQTIE